MLPYISLAKSRFLTINYQPGTYVKEFDGWRGVGICFVVLAHYFPGYFIGSWVFMEMFFVMSGFLITGILMDTKLKPRYFRNFFARRVVRVFPLYYMSLVILFFLIPNSWIDLSYYRQHQVWFWLYAENWLFSLQGWPTVKALHHYWSLAIEEQIDIVWPFIVMGFSTRNLLKFCIFIFFFQHRIQKFWIASWICDALSVCSNPRQNGWNCAWGHYCYFIAVG